MLRISTHNSLTQFLVELTTQFKKTDGVVINEHKLDIFIANSEIARRTYNFVEP